MAILYNPACLIFVSRMTECCLTSNSVASPAVPIHEVELKLEVRKRVAPLGQAWVPVGWGEDALAALGVDNLPGKVNGTAGLGPI
eukprot:scaffold279599_cov42-Prasinocladus_malaysianus.AAC.1